MCSGFRDGFRTEQRRLATTVADVNDSAIGRLRRAVGMVVAVALIGTSGYLAFGMNLTDAVYQTVTTITTVGFRELHDFSPTEQ